MRYVLIVAPKSDEHASVVAKRLESIGAEAVILDSAEFPSLWRLSVRISNRAAPGFVLERDGTVLNENNLAGVWWRRPHRYLPASDVVESHFRQFVLVEAREAFEGWLLSLGRRVINSPSAESAARKLVQLKYAVQAGLNIPKSIATNSPEQARSFYELIGPETVFKPFTGPSWQMIATQRLTADALQHLQSVAHAPVIFQEEIRKTADIRVTIVDQEIFAVSIRSKREEPPIDWRIEADCEYAAHTLPAPVANSLLDLMNRLGLRFGACDLALMPDGQYVFFEVNPGGQWLFAEIMVGHPVSMALARALLNSGSA